MLPFLTFTDGVEFCIVVLTITHINSNTLTLLTLTRCKKCKVESLVELNVTLEFVCVTVRTTIQNSNPSVNVRKR